MRPQFQTLQDRLKEIMQTSGQPDKHLFARGIGYTKLDSRSAITRVLAGRPIIYSALCNLAFALNQLPVLFQDNGTMLLGRFAERCAEPIEPDGPLAGSVEDYFYYEYLSDVLRARRNQQGQYVSQTTLDSMLGLPRGIISNVERGEGRPNTARLEHIFGHGMKLKVIYLPDIALLVEAVRQSSAQPRSHH